MTEAAEIIRDLLEYIAWLEIEGGCSYQDGGLSKPIFRAERFLEEHSDDR